MHWTRLTASFFDDVQRIGSPDYVPNEMDVLRARTKTTGISETKFRSGQLSIQCVVVCATSLTGQHVRLRRATVRC